MICKVIYTQSVNGLYDLFSDVSGLYRDRCDQHSDLCNDICNDLCDLFNDQCDLYSDLI